MRGACDAHDMYAFTKVSSLSLKPKAGEEVLDVFLFCSQNNTQIVDPNARTFVTT